MPATIKLNIDEDGDPVLAFTIDEKSPDVEKRLLNRFFLEGTKYGVELRVVQEYKDSAEKTLVDVEVRIGGRTL